MPATWLIVLSLCMLCALKVNQHVIQSLEGRAELQELLAINKQVLNQQTNKPTFGLVQDALTGSYHMTRKNVMLRREQVMNLMTSCEQTMQRYHPNWTLPVPAVMFPEPLWTGKQIYSMLFPPLNLTKLVRNAAEWDPLDQSERFVCIRQGELLSGALCKQTVGAVTGGVVHIIAKDFHMDQACIFLSDAQRMVNRWFLDFGFSTGISDCVAKPEVEDGVRDIIDHAYKKIDKIHEQVRQSEGSVTKRDVEEPVTTILRDVINQTGKLAQTQMSDQNRIYSMATAGSKGNPINLSQIMACVGQQTVDGSRIHAKNSLDRWSTLNTRTLTCYAPGDEHPETHGFCPNSYAIGLEPEEVYMHAMGGREGLVDTGNLIRVATFISYLISSLFSLRTAVKTSVTGYIQRRLLKAMEALTVHFDGSVRNAEGYIVDFLYGGDGMDPQYLEPFSLPLVGMTNVQIRDTLCLISPFPKDLDPQWKETVALEEKTLLLLRDECRRYKKNSISGEIDSSVLLPAHIPRLMENILAKYHDIDSGSRVVLPTEVYTLVTQTLQKIHRPQGTVFMEAALRSNMCTGKMCRPQSKWTRPMVQEPLAQIEKLFFKGAAESGEMVGALSSESIGEPSTQLVRYVIAEVLLAT